MYYNNNSYNYYCHLMAISIIFIIINYGAQFHEAPNLKSYDDIHGCISKFYGTACGGVEHTRL